MARHIVMTQLSQGLTRITQLRFLSPALQNAPHGADLDKAFFRAVQAVQTIHVDVLTLSNLGSVSIFISFSLQTIPCTLSVAPVQIMHFVHLCNSAPYRVRSEHSDTRPFDGCVQKHAILVSSSAGRRTAEPEPPRRSCVLPSSLSNGIQTCLNPSKYSNRREGLCSAAGCSRSAVASRVGGTRST